MTTKHLILFALLATNILVSGEWADPVEKVEEQFGIEVIQDHLRGFRVRPRRSLELNDILNNVSINSTFGNCSSTIMATFMEETLRHNWPIVKFLMKHCDINPNDTRIRHTNQQTLLHVAATAGDTDMVEWLLRNGASLEVEDGSGNTPFFQAARIGKLKMVKWLVNETGVDVYYRNSYGRTALHSATITDELNVVRWLVEVKNISMETRDYRNTSSLDLAADNWSWKVMKWFIEKNGGAYQTDDGSTLFDKIESCFKSNDVEISVDLNSTDINIVNQYGEGRLRDDFKSGNLDTIKWLSENRVPINIQSGIFYQQSFLHDFADVYYVLKQLELGQGIKITNFIRMTIGPSSF